jgi:hypothetical protein
VQKVPVSAVFCTICKRAIARATTLRTKIGSTAARYSMQGVHAATRHSMQALVRARVRAS